MSRLFLIKMFHLSETPSYPHLLPLWGCSDVWMEWGDQWGHTEQGRLESLGHEVLGLLVSKVMPGSCLPCWLWWLKSAAGGILSLELRLGRALQQPLALTQQPAFAMVPPHPQGPTSSKLLPARLWVASRSCLYHMDSKTDLKGKP